jgi:hypothetical protein
MRVHQEGGKEPETLIIGSASEFRALAEDLLSSLDGKPDLSTESFPPQVCGHDLNPNTGNGALYLSFNLETESGKAPPPAGSISKVLVGVAILLSILGIIQLYSWLRLVIA